MNEAGGLLSNPAVQSALIPLICSFIIAALLVKAGTRWQGIAILMGFMVAVWQITGLQFQPLTSTRKIILFALLLPVLGVILDILSQPRWRKALVFALLLGLAAVWVSWPVIGRQEGSAVWGIALRVALFAAWIGGSIVWLSQERRAQQSGMVIALGIGVGASAVLAATALYGQLAFAVAAATGGLLLMLLIRKSSVSLGTLGLFAAVTPLALLGGAATVYAKLPLTSLICLVFVPLFAAIPLYREGNAWIRTTIATVLGLLPAIPAIWIAWQAGGPPPL